MAAKQAKWRVELADGTAIELTSPLAVIGRNPDSSTPGEQRIALPDVGRTLSKTHARLSYDDGAWRLTDLNSTNGSRVLDRAGVATPLRPGEPVVVGVGFIVGEVGVRLAYELI
ncbi:FHA domain-containing protein [Agromyces larvae]|uniref:FHA domain-containing protein n=1 Tax=Agromyces larvae TaxID=2929802 RepID=A0ABY4C5D5_9MICO|nr:FHA domain-containing protein [Agromyces larvae]